MFSFEPEQPFQCSSWNIWDDKWVKYLYQIEIYHFWCILGILYVNYTYILTLLPTYLLLWHMAGDRENAGS
jgi:hypothetical protein